MSLIKESCNGKDDFSDHEKLGFAVSCMLMNNNYSFYHIKTLQYWTLEAIGQKQFKILFDYLDRPLGYITWAYLREDTLHRLIHDPHYCLHISEWNEGGIMCILDFCCRPGSAVYCLDYFKGVTPFANVEKMVWQSKRSGRLMTRKNRMQRK